MKILLKLFSLKLVASLLGLAYSILQVRYFGASRAIEIYFAAQSLVYLVTSLTQSGQLAEIFLPEFHKLNKIKPGLGYKGLNIVLTRMILFGSLLIILVFLFAPFFIDLLVPGFSQADKDFATLIFRILIPVMYLQIVNSFFITVLNAEQRFGRAELLGLTNTIVNILALILLYPYIELWALVVSLLLGKIIEFIFYISQLYKSDYRIKFSLSMIEFDHKAFFRAMQSTFLYAGATQIYSIVLTASISFLPEGTYAIFKYVQNLANKIKGLFTQPFMTIFFTRYSLLVQSMKSVTNEFRKNLSAVINVNVVIIIGSVLLGDFIIELIWGGKKFTSEDIGLAYYFLMFNMIAILLSSIGGIYRKMSVSQGRAKELYVLWVVSQLLSAGFSYILIKYFGTNGLFFIIPINTLLMGVVSFYVYTKTLNRISYNFFNLKNLICLGLICIAILTKYYFNQWSSSEEKITIILVFSLQVILLSLYPIISTYNVLKSEKSIN